MCSSDLVLVSKSGAIWCGTENQGIVRLEKDHVTRFTAKEGLHSEAINTLLEDHNGNLWAGTKNGLHRWNGSRFISFSREQGLPASDVRCLFEDREGNLWVGTGKSLTRFNNTKFTPFEFGRGEEVTVNQIVTARDGGVWAACNEGLYYTLGSKQVH